MEDLQLLFNAGGASSTSNTRTSKLVSRSGSRHSAKPSWVLQALLALGLCIVWLVATPVIASLSEAAFQYFFDVFMHP